MRGQLVQLQNIVDSDLRRFARARDSEHSTVYFIVAVGIFVLALIAIALYYNRRSQKSSEKNWERLLKRLTAVDRSSIAEVALDIIDESGASVRKDDASAFSNQSRLMGSWSAA